MKLLCIADEECQALWDYYTPDKIEGVDLIIACGDLNRQYLEYLTTMVPVPVLYVHGNHDENYDHHPPEGAICLDDNLFVYQLLDRYHPQLMLHGHIHLTYGCNIPREHRYGATRIVNCYERVSLEAEPVLKERTGHRFLARLLQRP